nr:MAG TPA: Muskelin N-terminus [Bacteriophage sp.]
MTNREKFRDELDNMLSAFLAVAKGKPVPCDDTNCRECDFEGRCTEREDAVLDWLNAEYQEPSVDWSKVPIDTPVLASNDGKHWSRLYFAGVGDDGNPETFYAGATSWSNCIVDHRPCKYVKLAEDNE